MSVSDTKRNIHKLIRDDRKVCVTACKQEHRPMICECHADASDEHNLEPKLYMCTWCVHVLRICVCTGGTVGVSVPARGMVSDMVLEVGVGKEPVCICLENRWAKQQQ